MVSFSFKQARFEQFHRAAIRFPQARFRYAGVDPPLGGKFDHQQAQEGVSSSGEGWVGGWVVDGGEAPFISRLGGQLDHQEAQEEGVERVG